MYVVDRSRCPLTLATRRAMGATQSVRSYYRMYVVVRYPRSVEGRIQSFSQDQFASLLAELKKVRYMNYEVVLSGRTMQA